MAITLRSVTGSALTHEELDINFCSFIYSASYSQGTISLYTTGSTEGPEYIPSPASMSFTIPIVSQWTGSIGYSYTDSQIQISGSLINGSGSISAPNNKFSHGEGFSTTATGIFSHAEGANSQALGTGSHAEGYNTQAIGSYAHSEGSTTQALGEGSHAEGYGTLASGSYSHAEGKGTQALGEGSHTGGYSTVAKGNHQFVAGQFNITSSEDSAFIIGGGESDSKRSNLIYASPATGVQVTGSLGVYGPVYVGGVLQLTELNPLPSGSAGMLAISSSGVGMSLFFHDGQDWQVLY